MLGFMGISGFFGLGNLQKIEADIILPEEIYAGVPCTAQLLVKNASSVTPRFILRFIIGNCSALLPYLPKRDSVRLPITLSFQKRGATVIKKIAVTSQFPVNFFVRSATVHTDVAFTVFPRPEPLPARFSPPAVTADNTGPNRMKRGSSGDMESVGLYSGREPLKQLHWKLSARHDELFVKELQAETGLPVMVNPDELPGNFEERLRYACHQINVYAAEGRAVGLTVGKEIFAPSANRADRLLMLAALACYDQN
ncbi:MAG: DUF58 domain-containing protein [Geobacter sp.]|nr:DUF58 domain-containing protein [Geobacter sp.]